MAGWDALLGVGSTAEQFFIWQVAGQVVSDLLGPTFALIAQDVNAGHPVMVLTPADLADAVIRNYITQADGAAEAAKSGLDSTRFGHLVDAAGNPPGPEWLARIQLRGDLLGSGTGPDSTSYEQGIAEGDTKNKWADIILKGSMEWPSPSEVIDAIVRSQSTSVPLDQLYEMTGADPRWLQLRIDTRGNPPSLTELIELKRRGLIPFKGTGSDALTFEQGIHEGDTKNKWEPFFEALTDYIPPPRTVATLLKTGSVTTDAAQGYYQDAGMSPDLAAAYVKSAKGEKMAGSKSLAEGTVLTLYETQAIDGPTAAGYLGKLGYDTADVAFMLELADLQRELKAINAAVSKVGSLYIGHKITHAAAVEALTGLDVIGPHQQHLLTTWDLERTANVKALTAAQIVDAWEYQVYDQPTATAELVAIGYTPFDAWTLLSVKNKAPLPGKPAQGPAGPGVIP